VQILSLRPLSFRPGVTVARGALNPEMMVRLHRPEPSIFPSSASRDFVRDWISTHRHEPVVETSTRATRSAFVDRPRRENLSPAWWNSIHTALRRQRPYGHAGLPAIARPGRASAGAIDSFRLAKLGASPRTSGAPLRSFHTLRLSPGPIYRDVAEPVYATGREPVGGNLIRVQIPSSRPFFARLELKRESAQPPRLNRGSLYQCQMLGALPTTATILVCPASVGSDVPGLYPGEAGAHPARGSNQFGPRSSVIRAHLSEG
jgi:hypothetical protein